MNGGRATLAIVRRRIDRAYACDWLGRFAALCLIAALFAPLLGRTATLVVLIIVLPLGGATESAHAEAMRRTSFFAMPLYGRQLARAYALAPVVTALAAPLGFFCGLAIRHEPLAPGLGAIVLAANIVGALVALGAVFRDGVQAWLYYALTLVCCTALAVPPLARLPHAVALSVGLAAVFAFTALRAFGETLARYDPLPF
ncbi:MAG: hypothetical protein GIX03_02230 [Candidatus Eremiobacteraeota bacterium]|nr:hypothetical protein [Candidatus Eremiobacteraeota bacterium]MBC5801835.1 hypothetical protein [Candidatus Eremiobacteraeota bacterium]MBC5822099.1 hypothetical protein [Candidatus Eremiobacteraeota bacterium]